MKNTKLYNLKNLFIFIILAVSFVFIGSSFVFQPEFDSNPIIVEYKGQFVPQTSTESSTTQSRMVFEVRNTSNKTLIVTLKIKEKGDDEWEEEIYIGPMYPTQIFVYPQKEKYYNKPYIAVAEWK